MKRIFSFVCVVTMLVAFAVPAFAIPGYPNFVAGATPTFYGTSKTFSFSLDSTYYGTVAIEAQIYDSDTTNSKWKIELYYPNFGWQTIATNYDAYLAPFVYSYAAAWDAGTYIVRVTMTGGSTGSGFKQATLFIWGS